MKQDIAGTAVEAPPRARPHPIAGPRSTSRDHPDLLGWASLAARLVGAVAVILVGAVHLDAYNGPYSAVPTIGALFIVNVVSATIIGAALILPVERLTSRSGDVIVVVAILAGIGLAAASFVMLIIAEHGTLFGFQEPGYDPKAISWSRRFEIAAMCMLSL